MMGDARSMLLGCLEKFKGDARSPGEHTHWPPPPPHLNGSVLSGSQAHVEWGAGQKHCCSCMMGDARSMLLGCLEKFKGDARSPGEHTHWPPPLPHLNGSVLSGPQAHVGLGAGQKHCFSCMRSHWSIW